MFTSTRLIQKANNFTKLALMYIDLSVLCRPAQNGRNENQMTAAGFYNGIHQEATICVLFENEPEQASCRS